MQKIVKDELIFINLLGSAVMSTQIAQIILLVEFSSVREQHQQFRK